MTQENKQIVRNFYEAANTRDSKALAELLDENIEIYQSEVLPWGGKYQGHQGFMSYAFKMLGMINSQAVIEQFIEAGDQVVAIGKTQGEVNSNSKKFEIRLAHVWTIKNEKLSRFEVYVDAPEMLRMLDE
ncbi:MAG: nuclear transport factor 2 family protein [Pyrinomonadaceae bacterium]